ncbi:Peptidoglycan-recognition protein SB2 [Gryllus bimaculatus]|nr:Peptidoglycan-recognition protein SB2 [Gryllus bimaculatus]
MEEKVDSVQSAPLALDKRIHCTCQLLHFVYLVSVLSLISGITLIVWWKYESDNTLVSIDFISRSAWEAKPVKTTAQPLCVNPPSIVVLMDSNTDRCYSFEDCSHLIRKIQEQDIPKHDDITYNFLIGNDGRVYEGRGWDTPGYHSGQLNDKSIGVALIGNFNYYQPSEKILEVCQKFLEEGVRSKKLDPNYKVIGRKQVMNKENNPGEHLWKIIRDWPRWTNCVRDGCSERLCNRANYLAH